MRKQQTTISRSEHRTNGEARWDNMADAANRCPRNDPQKARTCRISPEDLNAAYEASRCLVSALRFLKEAPATSLLEDLHLDAEVVALLKAMASSNVGKPAGPLGKLVNVEWKIGVAAMSDLCKNLNSPFVMLELTVEDSASHRSRHTIELTVPEFQKFASTMQELHSVMTTV
ncbi:hypothetical protein HPB51_017080 [Rhipicephalus microplus]|uniref:COMM domain-containing protein n=1 Tax=Rhipicephalus microplus TaxID=6941 RepID=A0A9J6F4K8_RHIMP|nr:hypothetical protein HPB51_017080 [Rhipicephalus microplus]